MGLKRKRDGYKTRRRKKKKTLEKKSSMPQGINISWRKQAKIQGPVRERSLPIAQWLPALGGEDVPRAPLPSGMSLHSAMVMS